MLDSSPSELMFHPKSPFVPQTTSSDGKAVGARVPPSTASLIFYGPCAISGYETGDPTEGCCQGSAIPALFLHIVCCLAMPIYTLFVWKPDPANIRGDGTQRTVNDRCCAGFWLGFLAVAFWENGDLCCTPDGQCTWVSPGALIATIVHFLLGCDSCFVCCCWTPDPMNFKRSTLNHGGGAPLVGAPVQAENVYVAYHIMALSGQQVPTQAMGLPVGAAAAQPDSNAVEQQTMAQQP